MLTELFPMSFCLYKNGRKQKVLVLDFPSVLLKDKPKIISFLLVSGPTNCPFFGQKYELPLVVSKQISPCISHQTYYFLTSYN